MMISLIAAMSSNRVIGYHNQLPWSIPEDLAYFRKITQNKPVIMGRKTFESIGRPLPQRRNIILSQDPAFKAPGCAVAQDIPSAIALSQPAPEIMIIGGARIYAQFLPLADKIYLSVIHQPYEGDSFFPEIDPAAWNTILLETHPAFKIYTLYKRSL